MKSVVTEVLGLVVVAAATRSAAVEDFEPVAPEPEPETEPEPGRE